MYIYIIVYTNMSVYVYEQVYAYITYMYIYMYAHTYRRILHVACSPLPLSTILRRATREMKMEVIPHGAERVRPHRVLARWDAREYGKDNRQ